MLNVVKKTLCQMLAIMFFSENDIKIILMWLKHCWLIVYNEQLSYPMSVF